MEIDIQEQLWKNYAEEWNEKDFKMEAEIFLKGLNEFLETNNLNGI